MCVVCWLLVGDWCCVCHVMFDVVARGVCRSLHVICIPLCVLGWLLVDVCYVFVVVIVVVFCLFGSACWLLFVCCLLVVVLLFIVPC